MSMPFARPRFATRRCFSPVLAPALALTLAVVLAPAALAQQRTGGNTGGSFGGGTTGGTGGMGNTAGTGGGGANDGGAGSVSGLPSADEKFSGGLQREEVVEQRGIEANGDPGARTTGRAGAQGGGFGGGFGGMGGFGGFGGLGGLSQMFGGAGQNQQPARSVRTRLSSAVAIPPLPPQSVGVVVNARLSSLPSSPRFGGVQVRMDGRTAILTGQVASEEDKRITRLLIRLEPGVSRIEDRLEVAPQESVAP